MEYINPSDMKVIDINSAYFGVGARELMDNAGKAVFKELNNQLLGQKSDDITIICGLGNNGGDGFSAALYLSKAKYHPRVYLVGGKEDLKTLEAVESLSNLEDAGVIVKEVNSADDMAFDSEFIVDALFGVGLKGEPREPYKNIINQINKSSAFKLSIDVPSGMGTKTVVNSDLVVTLHKAKKGLEQYNTVIGNIGVPKNAETHVGPGDLLVNLTRKPKSHKGENGRVMVVGGSRKYHGAPILAGLGALSAGCDLVTLIVPEPIVESSRSNGPDFIVRPYEGDFLNNEAVDSIAEFSKTQDACVIGPGLGTDRRTMEALQNLLPKIQIPTVIDADALKIIEPKSIREINTVITPHSTEFHRITGEKIPNEPEMRKKVVEKWANKLNTTVLLKSAADIIFSPKGMSKINETGNPGMTVGGTGDVLAGVTGSFIAQGMDSFTASCCAAFVCGSAGDTLYQFKGYGYTASEVAKEVAFTIKRFIDLYG